MQKKCEKWQIRVNLCHKQQMVTLSAVSMCERKPFAHHLLQISSADLGIQQQSHKKVTAWKNFVIDRQLSVRPDSFLSYASYALTSDATGVANTVWPLKTAKWHLPRQWRLKLRHKTW